MLVNDGKIEKMFIEDDVPGDPFNVSNAETMIKYINPNYEIPKSIALFTRPGCSFCAEAKDLLNKHQLKYEEHILNQDYSVKTLVAISGTTTVPQIFMNGERIGGAEQLKAMLK